MARFSGQSQARRGGFISDSFHHLPHYISENSQPFWGLTQMPRADFGSIVRYLRRTSAAIASTGRSDSQLLAQFIAKLDAEAFAASRRPPRTSRNFRLRRAAANTMWKMRFRRRSRSRLPAAPSQDCFFGELAPRCCLPDCRVQTIPRPGDSARRPKFTQRTDSPSTSAHCAARQSSRGARPTAENIERASVVRS